MELFDVLDKNRKALGYTKERGKELLENEYNVGVENWIFNNKKLLMTRRSLEKSHPGEWEVPGGCSQVGESSIDTLKREMQEEIGIDIKNDFELIDTDICKHQFVDIYKSNILLDISKINIQIEEVSDVKFVSREEFLQMVSDGIIVNSVYNRYLKIKDKIKNDW